MNDDQRGAVLRELAEQLAHRRMLAAARILLDVVAPLGFLASQVAVFVQPMVPHSRWRSYVAALDDQHGWNMLHELVQHDEPPHRS